MKDDTKVWLKYSEENLKSAKILLESNFFNLCLQNAQQSVEKALKAILIEKSLPFKKTHSITELKNILEAEGVKPELSDENCELLDSIYLTSKYPIGNILPFYEPTREICSEIITIAESVLELTWRMLE